MPTKKTVLEPLAAFLQGSSLEHFIDGIMEEDLGLKKADDAYALEQELPPVEVEIRSPKNGLLTDYTIYPVDVWVAPGRREDVRAKVGGKWVACRAASELTPLSPTAAAVFHSIEDREKLIDALYAERPDAERPGAERRLLGGVGERPTMEALARSWLSHNRGGVRRLSGKSWTTSSRPAAGPSTCAWPTPICITSYRAWALPGASSPK